MDGQLERIASKLPRPVPTSLDGFLAYRFSERLPQQAIFLRLLRVVSGLKCAYSLLVSGYLQEQAVICRSVDEFSDDVVFLSLASKMDPHPDLLQKFLDGFFTEESSHLEFRSRVRVKGRPTVSRKDIINFIMKHQGIDGDPFSGSNAGLAVHYALSGYVHGAAAHTMEMYDPSAGCFFAGPNPQSPFIHDHLHDLWNYLYRSLISFALACFALGDKILIDDCMEFIRKFEEMSGGRIDFR